jgi:hypothetical protein
MSDDDMRKWETDAARDRYERNRKALAEEKAASERQRKEASGGGPDGCIPIVGIIFAGTAAAMFHQQITVLFS